MGECKRCVTCQNCYSCQGSCYTCEVGYAGEAVQDQKQSGVEQVEFPDIWHAIYDALDRIAFQMERQNILLEQISKKIGNVPVRQFRQQTRQGQGRVNVKRRALKPVEEELKLVPDTVGKVKIKKELKLD